MSRGYVYIISNPCIRYEYVENGRKAAVCPVKIGIAKDVEKRLGTLNTSLPENFVHHMSVAADDPKAVENVLHEYLRDYRIRTKDGEKTEFFRCSVEKAINEFKKVAKHMHLKEYHIRKMRLPGRSACRIKTNQKVEPAKMVSKQGERKIAAPFTFASANVPIGSEVEFVLGGQKAKVVGEKHIEFEGGKYSLSGLVKKLMPREKCTRSGAYQGPKYFTYKGQLLTERRSSSNALQ